MYVCRMVRFLISFLLGVFLFPFTGEAQRERKHNTSDRKSTFTAATPTKKQRKLSSSFRFKPSERRTSQGKDAFAAPPKKNRKNQGGDYFVSAPGKKKGHTQGNLFQSSARPRPKTVTGDAFTAPQRAAERKTQSDPFSKTGKSKVGKAGTGMGKKRLFPNREQRKRQKQEWSGTDFRYSLTKVDKRKRKKLEREPESGIFPDKILNSRKNSESDKPDPKYTKKKKKKGQIEYPK